LKTWSFGEVEIALPEGSLLDRCGGILLYKHYHHQTLDIQQLPTGRQARAYGGSQQRIIN
jgi:hypothetical protein